MEQSYYNVLARIEGGAVLYNVAHQTLVELDEREVELYESVESCDDEEFVQALAEEQMLVVSAEAEADRILYRHNRYRYGNQVLDLTIMPTRACNCSCDFCYVERRQSRMPQEVQQAILEFVEQCYNQNAFKKLRVTWYGGEPLLAIDIIEAMSQKMMAFCDERGVAYHGHIITNGTLADASMCKRLVERCGMVSIMPTICGDGAMHEYQRPLKSGAHYFDTFKDNITCMADAGMLVRANFVLNHNNFEQCAQMAGSLCSHENITCRLTRTFAYGRSGFTLGDPDNTPIKLFSREEFGEYYARFLRGLNLDAEGYEDALSPQCLYCAAWVDRQYFIDDVGDVFACMIDMDKPEHALFNVMKHLEGDESYNFKRKEQYMGMVPARDKQCRTCSVLPICQGGCAYWRIEGADVCHDMKDCIEDLVLDYYRAVRRES